MVGLLLLTILVLLAGQVRQEAKIRKVEGSIIGFLLELVSGIAKLRTAGAENRAFARWASQYADQVGLTIKARRFSNGLQLFMAVFPMLISMDRLLWLYLKPLQPSPPLLFRVPFSDYR